jgi:hypothetical protein
VFSWLIIPTLIGSPVAFFGASGTVPKLSSLPAYLMTMASPEVFCPPITAACAAFPVAPGPPPWTISTRSTQAVAIAAIATVTARVATTRPRARRSRRIARRCMLPALTVSLA